MWSTVDNSVTPLARNVKPGWHPVDNECGQMCTKSCTGGFLPRKTATSHGQDYCSFFKSIRRATRGFTSNRFSAYRVSIACRFAVDNLTLSTGLC